MKGKSFTARVLRIVERDYGCEVSRAQSGHYKIRKDGLGQVVMSATPSDVRAERNIIGDIRRHLGIDLKGKL